MYTPELPTVALVTVSTEPLLVVVTATFSGRVLLLPKTQVMVASDPVVQLNEAVCLLETVSCSGLTTSPRLVSLTNGREHTVAILVHMQ